MEDYAIANTKRYMIWLVITCFAGGASGWTIYGMQHGFVFWALPLFWIGTIGFTINGDNIIESTLILTMAGLLAFGLSRIEYFASNLGEGILLGAYIALAISKIGFALAKQGIYGNKPFS